MTGTFASEAATGARLDYALLGKAFLFLGIGLILISPLSPEPLAVAVGALIPWAVIQIVRTPTMPAPIAFWLIWQWLQTFARAIQTIVDGLPMSRSVYGSAVESAYWFMLSSVVVLAVAARAVLGNIRPESEYVTTYHLRWRPADLFMIYLGSVGLSMICARLYDFVPSLYQQIDAVAKYKLAAAFMLFAVALTTGRGHRLVVITLMIETAIGMTGLLSDFKAVFLILIAAGLAEIGRAHV